MAGLFGTRAVLQTDIDLLLQIVAVSILAVGFLYRRRGKKHGAMMGVATILEAATFVWFMGPVFVNNIPFFVTNFTPLVMSFLLHAFAGSVTLVLATSLSILWVIHLFNIGPCYKRKWLMDVTAIFWVASAAFGVTGYILAYVA
jgi:hypothetical protein